MENESILLQNETSVEEINILSEEQLESSNNNGEINSTFNDNVYTFSLEESQYNYISGNLYFLCHISYIQGAMLLTILIYLFLARMLERRKC